jgi:hypothetical protein
MFSFDKKLVVYEVIVANYPDYLSNGNYKHRALNLSSILISKEFYTPQRF